MRDKVEISLTGRLTRACINWSGDQSGTPVAQRPRRRVILPQPLPFKAGLRRVLQSRGGIAQNESHFERSREI